MTLNIAAYQFTPIEDPPSLAVRLRRNAEAGDLRGTILVAHEGINLFLAGAEAAVRDFIATLRADPRFTELPVKESRSEMQPFARLKVKVKDEIISFRQEKASPLEGRAPALAPSTLARWIGQGHDDAGQRVVLVDTRNRVETELGTFAGALTLPIDKFTELPEAMAHHRDTLADATVVSFCTGGIRCEKAALWMQADGIGKVWQLDGGILGYFDQVGGYGYEGHCFVFDERVALDPALRPIAPDAPAF